MPYDYGAQRTVAAPFWSARCSWPALRPRPLTPGVGRKITEGGMRRLVAVFFLLAHSLGSSAWIVLASGTQEDNGLRFQVVVEKKTYAVGEAVRIHATWTNTTDQPMVIPSWGGPGNPGRALRFGVYYRGTERLVYHGVIMCGIYGWTTLDPQKRHTSTWTIDDIYDLERPGMYIVRAAYVNNTPEPQAWTGMIVHPAVEFGVGAGR